MGLLTSGLGAHLTWTLPFGLLIMFAIFNRFDPRASRKPRAISARRRGRPSAMSCCRSSCPRVIGVGLFGFTLSWDEIARSSQAIGARTRCRWIAGPDHDGDDARIYALGTVTTASRSR